MLLYEFQPMLNEKNLKCNLHVPEGIIMRCDANRMQRVFDNLLRNAVIYSFNGTDINITVTRQEENVMISFTNHGDTIPAEKLERIFEQFYRLDASRSTSSGEAGLGIPGKNNCRMGGHCIKRKAMAFFTEPEIALADFKEYFNIPAFSIKANDFIFT